MRLVLTDAARPPAYGPVLAHEDVLGNLVEKSAVPVSDEKVGEGREGKGKYLKSWDTTTTPPEKALMASASESMVGMSRPLVGSSSNSMLGLSMARRANTILDFCDNGYQHPWGTCVDQWGGRI